MLSKSKISPPETEVVSHALELFMPIGLFGGAADAELVPLL